MGDAHLRVRRSPILVMTIRPFCDVTAVALAIGVADGQLLPYLDYQLILVLGHMSAKC